MSNPLYSFFSSLFSSAGGSLLKGTLIQIGDKDYLLNKELIRYTSKTEDKQSPLRFAFVGGSIGQGRYGLVKHVKSCITPHGFWFDKDKSKRLAFKIVADCSESFPTKNPRDIEFKYASKVHGIHAKKSGVCSKNRMGIVMRYFEGETLGRIVRRESYQLFHVEIDLGWFTPPELVDFFHERNAIVKVKNELYEYHQDNQELTELKGYTKEEREAWIRLNAICNTIPINKRTNASTQAMQDLARLKKESFVPMSIDERLSLTLSLLKAYKEQILDAGLCHNDIKPENIIINRQTGTAHFIDFGFTKKLNKEVLTYHGSPLYSSPEQILLGLKDYDYVVLKSSSDIFSLGRVLAFFWGVDLTEFGRNLVELVEKNKNIHLTTLFSQLTAVPDARLQRKITKILTLMLKFNPDSRPDIVWLIDKVEGLLKDYSLQTIIDPGIGLPGCC